jgi:hypothetical protein
MPAPYAGNTVRQGQGRVGMLHHIQHGKIIAHEGMGQAGIGKGREQPQRLRCGPCQHNPVTAPLVSADEAQQPQHQRHEKGKDEREMP